MNLWDRRIERARALEKELPAAAEMLSVYREIAALQRDGADRQRFLDLLKRRLSRASRDAAERLADLAVEQIAPGGHEHVPLCAVLRPEGDGARRSLLCAVCLTEWEFNRIRCPDCGEEDEQKLPVFTAEEMPWVRLEACESCWSYLKAIDLTKDGLAVPEVDEIAAIALDMWAAEQGYAKRCPNLFGL
jgi:formate dehydrogenase maturation protein FdhE